VELATRVLESGVSGALIGTRALLGEGWDCPAVNCLVDLTVAATGVSVQQMRGRSLRLDPGDPQKLASNWDVVCVAPDLVRGSADYARFVRKHLHLYAPADDGEIEAGPSHVHPELSPFAPPPVGRLAELNRTMLARAAARDEARERWRIGEPYRGADLRTLVARPRPGVRPLDAPDASRRPVPISQRTPLALAGGGAVLALIATVVFGAIALPAGIVLAAGGLGWAAVRLGRARDRLPLVLPLDRAARSVIDAYRGLGELSEAGAASLAIEPRESGYLRCVLTEATPEESARFATALDELVAVADAPRYLARAPSAAAVPGPPPPRAGRPRRPQGARGGVRSRVGPPSGADRAGVRAALRRGPPGARRGRGPRWRLRDAGARYLGVSERVLRGVLAILSGAVDRV
jgi:hypothetical protein